MLKYIMAHHHHSSFFRCLLYLFYSKRVDVIVALASLCRPSHSGVHRSNRGGLLLPVCTVYTEFLVFRIHKIYMRCVMLMLKCDLYTRWSRLSLTVPLHFGYGVCVCAFGGCACECISFWWWIYLIEGGILKVLLLLLMLVLDNRQSKTVQCAHKHLTPICSRSFSTYNEAVAHCGCVQSLLSLLMLFGLCVCIAVCGFFLAIFIFFAFNSIIAIFIIIIIADTTLCG